MVMQNSRVDEADTGDYLYNCDRYLFADCPAEGTDGKGGYYRFCFLRIIFLSPAPQSRQHIIVSGNNSFAHKADAVVRSWLATVVCVSAWTCAFLPPNPLLSI